MKVLYNGPKKERVVEFPIPLLFANAKTEEVRFVRGKPIEVKDELIEQLREQTPEYFREYFTVIEDPMPQPKGSGHVK
jgi:hypothetical protein